MSKKSQRLTVPVVQTLQSLLLLRNRYFHHLLLFRWELLCSGCVVAVVFAVVSAVAVAVVKLLVVGEVVVDGVVVGCLLYTSPSPRDS